MAAACSIGAYPRNETIDNNHYGTQGELVLANSDGTNPRLFGGSGEYPWASWSPDGKQIACLSIKGISFVDMATKHVVRRLDRKGFFQQLTWSPDGKWLCGVANDYGTGWSIARMDAAAGTAQCREPRRLLHARLVSGLAERDLLLATNGSRDKQRLRLDPALDGRCRGKIPPPALW